jgi:hypothetical protein
MKKYAMSNKEWTAAEDAILADIIVKNAKLKKKTTSKELVPLLSGRSPGAISINLKRWNLYGQAECWANECDKINGQFIPRLSRMQGPRNELRKRGVPMPMIYKRDVKVIHGTNNKRRAANTPGSHPQHYTEVPFSWIKFPEPVKQTRKQFFEDMHVKYQEDRIDLDMPNITVETLTRYYSGFLYRNKGYTGGGPQYLKDWATHARPEYFAISMEFCKCTPS